VGKKKGQSSLLQKAPTIFEADRCKDQGERKAMRCASSSLRDLPISRQLRTAKQGKKKKMLTAKKKTGVSRSL